MPLAGLASYLRAKRRETRIPTVRPPCPHQIARNFREAASRISFGLQARYPEAPWRDISDTRNRVIHEYFDVDMEIVQAVVRDDLPSLVEQLETVLEEIKNQSREGNE